MGDPFNEPSVCVCVHMCARMCNFASCRITADFPLCRPSFSCMKLLSLAGYGTAVPFRIRTSAWRQRRGEKALQFYSPVSNVCNEVSLYDNIQRHSVWCLEVIVPFYTALVRLGSEIAFEAGRPASTEMLINWKEFREEQQKWLTGWGDWFMRED